MGTVDLEDLRLELPGYGRHVRYLEGTCGDHDLISLDPPIGRLDHKSSVLFRQGSNATVELDRKLVGGRILLQVGDDLVAVRIAVRVTGKNQARKAVVATRGEEDQRVPAIAPGGADRVGALEDHEPATLLREEVADRQARLAGSDHGDIKTIS